MRKPISVAMDLILLLILYYNVSPSGNQTINSRFLCDSGNLDKLIEEKKKYENAYKERHQKSAVFQSWPQEAFRRVKSR